MIEFDVKLKQAYSTVYIVMLQIPNGQDIFISFQRDSTPNPVQKTT